MCNETASSKWKLINNPGMKVDVTVDANETSFYNDTDLSDLASVKIVGGEPFINKFHAEYLDNFISHSNNPQDIVLHYNTNGTVFPNNKVLDYWKNVKEVHITFSVDAIGNLNDYLRPGSSWDIFTSTIEKFKSTPGINFVFTTHSVVSNISVWELDSLVKWKTANFGHPDGFFILDRPRHLSIKTLPQDKKDKLLEYINKVDTGEYIYKAVRNELNKENKTVYTEQDIAKKEEKLDEYFNQNFWNVRK
jgi:sulfatase maturation enzyme AslB (radical SAM superfamily)